MTSSPPNIPPEVWTRFVAKVTTLQGFACPALWHAPPRDDGYGQFWVPAHAEQLLGEPDQPDPADMPGAQTLFDLDPMPVDTTDQPERPAGRPWRAHRVSWAAWYGPIGPYDVVMHRCDRPLCAPITREDVDRHLILGTLQSNAEDRESKGRTARRGRHDLMLWGSADRRGPHLRSLAIHQALTASQAAGLTGRHLTRVVAVADAAGSPFPGQLVLRPPARRRKDAHRISSVGVEAVKQLELTHTPPE